MLLRVVVLWRRLVQALSSNSVLRVLSSNKAGDDVTYHDEAMEEEENPEFWKSPPFNSEKQVRVILFQETDSNGRKILFDSKSLRDKENKEINSISSKRKKRSHSSCSLENVNKEVEKPKRNSLKIPNDEVKLYYFSWKSPPFNSEKQVRVILFQETDSNGRKILFDSKSLRDKENKEINSISSKRKKRSHSSCSLENVNKEVEKPKRNSLKIPNDEIVKRDIDLHMLEEMVFGSVGMTYSGTTMKIHTVRSPPHLIISLVFPAPVPNENRSNREKELEESGSWHHSSNEIQISKCSDVSSVAHSIPVDVPGGLSLSNHYNHYGGRYISNSLQSTGSTRSCHSLSPISPNSVSSSLNCSGSFNSLQRRLLRNMATSIEFGLHPKSDESSSVEEVGFCHVLRLKNSISKAYLNRKMSVILTCELYFKIQNFLYSCSRFHEFFFSHVTIIEGHVLRLKNSISKAYLNRKMSVILTCEGIKKFHRSLQDLYTAPRLSSPFWLTRMLPEMNHRHLCYKFISQFVLLLDKYERKETNFFVSTLLSAVLTHHLAWVPTVTPSDVLAEDIGNHKNVAQWLEMLAKSHPYNPLWMQLGDMYGCLGFPNKLARTIVTGTNCDTINSFLFILSYFIRCSGIWEHVFEKSIITAENLTPLSAKDIGLESANLEASSNITDEKKKQMFNSYLPKRKYSLQHTFNKWTQNTQKNFNLSLENEYDQYRSKETNWKHFRPKYDFETEHDTKPRNFNSVDTSDNFFQNNTEDTVFSLDENLLCDNSFVDNSTNHKAEILPKFTDLHKPDSFLDSLGYSSMDDQQDEKHLSKQSWNYNLQSKNSDLLIVDVNSYNYEEENEFIPTVTLEKADFNESRNCSKLHENKLYLCQTNLDSDCYTNYNGTVDVMEKMQCSEANIDLEKWDKSDLNDASKSSDDGPEEGYHSMEETKVTVPKHRRRHLSENKNVLKKMTELQLPKFQVKEVQTGPSLYRGYGWSLLASTSNHYMTDFCLQGIKGDVKEEEIRDDLLTAIEFPVLGEPITEAVGIIADTEKWKVKLISTNRSNGDCEGSPAIQVGMSSLVADVCESILQMHKFNMPPELCMMHLEDRLQELYFRSRFLAEYLSGEPSRTGLNKATALLGLNLSDINLLVAVGTTHTPQLAAFNR
ncbi:folliculin-interacting protein 2-like [Centruroides sculpturatus]|uniref:folliculin-interacting protein 2-like n=1 Tax=Centruroides sculpturatus TaxID=218467 RepID=UPI000C6DFD85|nr:folliculin-interacting protein 2-like [Centruroides sculpturatus]